MSNVLFTQNLSMDVIGDRGYLLVLLLLQEPILREFDVMVKQLQQNK
jgi:hypothetical protein